MERARGEDRHRPYIDLVDRVALVAAVDAVHYRRARARLGELRDWFARHPGWPVIYSRDMIRLVKTPAQAFAGHGFSWVEGRLDYELLVWVLWFGERLTAEQFILSDLVRELEAQVTELVGPHHVDWNNRDHRYALGRVLAALERMWVLRRIDGNLEEFIVSQSGDTLYEFTGLAQHLLVHLPDIVYQALVVDRAPALLRRPVVDRGGAEQRLYRTLLLSPALYASHDPEAFELLKRRDARRRFAEELARTFGWDLEVTGAYASLLRPAADSAGQAVFPTRAALSHVVLLLCAAFRERVAAGDFVPDSYGRIGLSRARFESELVHVRRSWGACWGVAINAMPPESLAQEVEREMREWGLLEGAEEEGHYFVLPLAARFRGTYRTDGQGMDVIEQFEE